MFIHFTNQITLKPSLEEKLKLIFKFNIIIMTDKGFTLDLHGV